jgi:hypothetical protein
MGGTSVLSHRRRDAGAAAVEFALVLPLLLVIVFGIIDFGRMLNAQITTSQAAREGARVATLGGTDAEVTDRVNWAVGATGVATPEVESCPADPGRDDAARVTVTYEFTYVTPVGFMAGFFADGDDDTVPLTARAYMPCRG